MKYIFLFGAGASHGCNGLSKKLPLGRTLYKELGDKFGMWKHLGSREEIDQAFKKKNNFEDGMWKLREDLYQHGHVFTLYLKDMMKFFSDVKIIKPNSNLYVQLLKKLVNKKIINNTLFSTLNYDCLLEEACDVADIEYSYLLNNDLFKIYKLHGSYNFLSKSVQFNHCSYTLDVSVDPEIKIIKYNEMKIEEIYNNDLPPALAVYMREKPIQVGKSFLGAYQQAWKKEVLEAEKIFVIGIGTNDFLDDHIWEPLQRTKAQIIYCSGSNEESSFNSWKNKHKRLNDIIIPKYFEDSFEEICKIIDID